MIIYEVNKEKRVVTARFEGDKEYWSQSLVEMCNNIFRPTCMAIPYRIIGKVLDGYTDFVGKAKCHPNDVWDEEKGKNIAKQKLLAKWYNVKDCVLENAKDFVDKVYDDVTDRINKKLWF